MIIIVFMVPIILVVMFLLATPAAECDRKLSIWQRIRRYKDSVHEWRLLPKELIMAMVQRKVYKLGTAEHNGYENEEHLQQLRNFLTAASNNLDALKPAVRSMDSAIDSFCDRIEKIVVKYEVGDFFLSITTNSALLPKVGWSRVIILYCIN